MGGRWKWRRREPSGSSVAPWLRSQKCRSDANRVDDPRADEGAASSRLRNASASLAEALRAEAGARQINRKLGGEDREPVLASRIRCYCAVAAGATTASSGPKPCRASDVATNPEAFISSMNCRT
jgi:hypothetical protein